jgi:hypothetical protein
MFPKPQTRGNWRPQSSGSLPIAAYLHIHFAAPGCHAARVVRFITAEAIFICGAHF